MKKLNTFAMVVGKVLEILHWMAAALEAGLAVAALTAQSWLGEWLARSNPQYGATLETYHFELMVVNRDGSVNMWAIGLYAITAALMFSLMAMVFRNIYLILRTSQGKTRFSKGNTPFQQDITRMVREIGYFYLAIPILGLIMSMVARMILGVETAEIAVNMEGLVTGILLLCLSQVFAYGTQLQDDVDGLL